MDVDKRKNRNYYTCGGFRHMAKNYRNRRMKVEDNSSNLNGEEGLGSPN